MDIELEQIKNNIAHQYEDEPIEMAEANNEIYNAKILLENIYLKVKNTYVK